MRHLTCAFVFLALVPLCLTTPVLAATVHVPAEEPTIQAGIDAASAGDTVLVACGTYYEHDLVMKTGVTLTSATGEADCAIIDAHHMGRVFSCTGLDAGTVVRGFTLTRGFAESGAGIRCDGGSSPLLENILVVLNVAESGGGMWCGDNSTPALVNVSFVQNHAIEGGGVFLSDASLACEDVTFLENSAYANGGGLYCVSVPPGAEIRDCTFADNAAANGGGLYCDSGFGPDIMSCTFAGNSATEHGGGVYCAPGSNALLFLSLVAFSQDGEGVYGPSSPSVHTCDVYGNADGEYGGAMGDPTGFDANISEDHWFCPETQNELSIHDVSPCAPANNVSGLLIGAHGVACYAAGVDEDGALPMSWGAIKSIHH